MSVIDAIVAETPTPNNLIVYRVLVDPDNHWAVYESPDGGTITPEEMQLFIDSLVQTHKDDTQWRLLQGLRAFYPCDLPYITPDRARRMKRPPKAKRYEGVYFAKHPAKAGLLKIGCSVDVYERMKTLRNEYRGDMSVVGFIEAVDCRKLEGAIHQVLKEHRRENEWFDEAAALSWLQARAI